jgi:hypothetical protein
MDFLNILLPEQEKLQAIHKAIQAGLDLELIAQMFAVSAEHIREIQSQGKKV